MAQLEDGALKNMEIKNSTIVLVGVGAVAAYLLLRSRMPPKASVTNVPHQPIRSPQVYANMYTDSHLTDVSGGQGG